MIILKIIGSLLKFIGILLLAVLILLLAVLCVPVGLRVKYEPEVTFGIRWLFIRYDFIGGDDAESKPPGRFRRLLARVWELIKLILAGIVWLISQAVAAVKRFFAFVKRQWRKVFKPKPKKKKRPAPKEEEPKPPEPSFFGALREQRGFFGALKFFVDLGKALGGSLVRIYRGVAVDEFILRVRITGEDAADTSIKYGQICSGAFPALSFLLEHTRHYTPKMSDIEITPDFGGEGIRVTFVGAFTVYPILVVGHLLWAVIKFAVSQIMITFKNKSQS